MSRRLVTYILLLSGQIIFGNLGGNADSFAPCYMHGLEDFFSYDKVQNVVVGGGMEEIC